MHRSGTSAITRVISLLGYGLPKSVLGANESNRLGHWESTQIIALNEEILHSAGTRWDDWTPFNEGWYETPLAAGYVERARELLRSEFKDEPMFVLKDPRVCRIAPLWLRALDEEGIDTRVVLPIRHPIEVSSSLYERDLVRMGYGNLLWLRYVLDAENASRQRTRFFFTYEQLLTDWPLVLKKMADELGWPWARSSAEVNEDIDGFLSPRHRRQLLRELGTREHDQWTRSTFEVLERWSTHGVESDGKAVLDEIRAGFDKAAPTFAALLTPSKDSRAKEQATRESAETTEDAASAAGQVPDSASEQANSPVEAADTRKEAAPATAAEAAAAADPAKVQAELLALIESIRSAQDDLRSQSERRTEQLTSDLHARDQKIAELESNLRQRQEENAQAWSELEREKAARHTAEQIAKELQGAEARVESLARLLRDAESREQRLSAQVSALQEDVEALKSQLAEKDVALAVAGERQAMSARTAALLQSEREEALRRVAAVEYQLSFAKSELETVTSLKTLAEANLESARESIDERFAEIASLSRILIDEETQRKRLQAQSSWLRQVNEVLLRKGKWWWQLMPREWQRRMQLRRVARAGLFDAEAYVRAYPDVANSGQDPLRHYIAHGLDEQRQF